MEAYVWEICKFWILQNGKAVDLLNEEFERYVNFEFYKTVSTACVTSSLFERYVNFEFYKTVTYDVKNLSEFERYVNFEFYKTEKWIFLGMLSLRDM